MARKPKYSTGALTGAKTGLGGRRPPKKPPTSLVPPKPPPPLGKKPGASSPMKPPAVPTDPRIAAIKQLLQQNVGDLSGYAQARAEILKSIGPLIQQGYGTAADAITGYGKGLSQGAQDSLQHQADEMSGQLNQTTGNLLTPDQYERAAASYNPGAAGEIGYGLGALLPGAAAQKQGAAFGAAADFLPGAALQEGQYAIAARQKEAMDDIAGLKMDAAAGTSAAGLPKASASLSEKLGYLTDVYGQPILTKKGKRIPISSGDDITAYQRAQLEISRAKENRYISNDNYGRQKDATALAFKTAADRRATERLIRAGNKIDTEWSRQAGHIVLADGTEPKVNGKFVTYREKPSKAGTTPGNTPYSKAIKAAASDTLRGKVVPGSFVNGQWVGSHREGGMDYNHAIRYLVETYQLTKAKARKALRAAGWKIKDAADAPIRYDTDAYAGR